MDSVKLFKLIDCEKLGGLKNRGECTLWLLPLLCWLVYWSHAQQAFPTTSKGHKEQKHQSRLSLRCKTNGWFVSRKKRFSQTTQRFLCQEFFGAFLIILGLFSLWAIFWCGHLLSVLFFHHHTISISSPRPLPPVFLVTYLSTCVLLLFLQVNFSASRNAHRHQLEAKDPFPDVR